MRILTHHTMKVVLSLITISLLLGFGITYVRSRPSHQSKLEGATIKLRMYVQNVDGSVVEKGAMKVELSANGNWRKTQYDEKGQIVRIIIKDVAKGGVFLLLPNQKDIAFKMSGAVASTDAAEPAEYRKRPGYKGETLSLGRTAFIEQMKDSDGGSTIEVTSIPAYNYPVKQTKRLDNGSTFIEEAVSIDAREPDPQRVRLLESAVISDLRKGGQ